MGATAAKKGLSVEREYRYEWLNSGNAKAKVAIAIPAHYTSHDVTKWKDQLGQRMDRAFEKIWANLSDAEKKRINDAKV